MNKISDIMKSNGISLSMIIFIIFLVLKLTDNIDWSWWWVTSPLWLPMLSVVVALMFAFILSIIVTFISGIFELFD
jgi:aspartokinase-like uncharacterized kinase